MSEDFVAHDRDHDHDKGNADYKNNTLDSHLDEDYDDNNLYYPLFLLGKENRYTILKELYDQCYRLTDLSKKVLDQERSEVNKIQRPVELLMRKHIIFKNNEGKICITNLGRRLFEMVDPIITVWKQKDYFLEHRIEAPFSSLLSGQLLKSIKVIEGYPAILREIIEIYKRSDTYLYNILNEVHYNKELIDTLNDNLDKKNGFHTKTIFGKNTIRDPDWKNRYEFFKRYKLMGKIEQKLVKRIDISLILTDRESLMFFPRANIDTSKGLNPDTQSALYFKDNKYLHLCCLDFFNLLWNDAEPFDHTKIK